jgi:DNA-binding transcriptional MocR family regulator
VTISFARGVPAPECLPVDELADCARAAIERDGPAVLNYGPVGGYGPLREWLAARHGVEAGRVFVTNGSLQALDLLLRRFAERGRILVEAPTYDRPLKIAARLGADLRTVPHDGEGLDVEALELELRRDPAPAFLYLLPTFQNPSGRTLSLDRRRRVVELAAEHGLTVLEDDPYGLVRFEGEALPTVFELDGGARVLFSSSFSKIVAPGVRVGYVVLPLELAAEVEAVAVNVYLTPALLTQATVFEFLRRGRLEPNVERVSGLLRVRRDAMLAALELELGGVATWSRPEGGYFLWLELPPGVDTGELLQRAEATGVSFVKGADFYPRGSGGRNTARLAFSFVSPSEIDEGVARLAVQLAPAASGEAVVG